MLRLACCLSLTMLALGCDREPAPRQQTQLHVYAASSLREVFADAEALFEAAHPEVDVQCTFAGSQVLRLHAEQGADVDVFAAADTNQVQALQEQQLVGAATIFARNTLVVVVPAANPARIGSFAELDRARRLVIGAKSVPIGAYTQMVLTAASTTLGADFVARVRSRIVSEESNVRLVRAKVELGEADAAIVYRSDAMASPSLRALPIPDALNVAAEYSVAIGSHSRHSDWARRWVDELAGPDMRARLRARGFVLP